MIRDLVESSGFEAYKMFKKILLEKNHADLVEKMNEEEEKILSEGKSIFLCLVIKKSTLSLYEQLNVQ